MSWDDKLKEKMQPKVLLEDNRGKCIRLSKADKAKLRRVVGATGSVDGMALVKMAIGYCLQSDIRGYN